MTYFFFNFLLFFLGCGLGGHAIEITQFVGDFEKISINAIPGFVLNCDEFGKISKCQHVEMTFKHWYYYEPNIVSWDYVQDRRWNIGLFCFFWKRGFLFLVF